MVEGNRPVAGHYAKQLRLLGPLPAADAGAYRLGHQNRLTLRRYGSLHAAFAISRRLASADGSGISHVFRLKTARVSAWGSASATRAGKSGGSLWPHTPAAHPVLARESAEARGRCPPK